MFLQRLGTQYPSVDSLWTSTFETSKVTIRPLLFLENLKLKPVLLINNQLFFVSLKVQIRNQVVYAIANFSHN